MRTTQSLDGKWILYYAPERSGRPDSYPDISLGDWQSVVADVPGNTQLDLWRAGVEPDPFYADNLHKYAKYEYYQWVYERTFHVDENLRADKYLLTFAGIDTLCDVYLNGIHIASTDNMFIEHVIDVTDTLLLGAENKLTVHIHSAMNYSRAQDFAVGMRGTEHRNEICYIRKAPHSFGWDIAPRFVTSGLWRSVSIVAASATEITECYYATSSVKDGNATLQYAVRFVTDSDDLSGYSIRVKGECNGHSFEFEHPAHFISMNYTDVIPCAKLWWPYGYGEQNMYDVTMELVRDGVVLDTKRDRIGLRTVALEHRFDVGNQEFKITVNSKPFFAKGTNWIPLDAFHSRDKERLERAHALLTECGCNMIRCWGGNVYEDHVFYNLCDEAGILIWQDFAMGNTNYPHTQDFADKISKEVASVVRKLRNHPSIALWCTDNEIDYKNEDFELPSRVSHYNYVAYDVLPRVCALHDPYRMLIKSSPEIPDGFHKYNVPEQHLWGPRGWFKADFYAKHSAKFISEFGFHGCPAPSGISKYIPKESLWPLDNILWAVHSTEDIRLGMKNDRNIMMRNHVKIMYGDVPEDMQEFALLSQIYQGEALKFMMEHCRSIDGFNGLLWWNMIDCWPQISDAVVDYYFNKKLAFNYIKRSQKPFLSFVTSIEQGVYPVYVSNHTHTPKEVRVTVRDADTNELLFNDEVSISADQTRRIGAISGTPDEQRLFVIKYEADGKVCENHFITGLPTYDKKDMLRWFEIIRKLDEPFSFVP